MSEYLWDRTGPADLDVAGLERRLAPLRFNPDPAWKPKRRRSIPYGAIAAALLVAAAGVRLSVPAPPASNWAVTDVNGRVNLGRRSASISERLRAGQSIVTGDDSRVTIENDDFGQVDLDSRSRLKLVGSKAGRETMSLERGRLHAYIWAPPRKFIVDTPSSRTIDLGCEYNLTIDEAGNGLVSVELGWVAFQFGGQESFIPEGADCRTHARRGPGIPYYRDATPEFIAALREYDDSQDAAALDRLLNSARAKDALSLWHLLGRAASRDREPVFDRFLQLVPVQVDRAKALARDPQTLDKCWNALGLDDAEWWREWKRDWRPQR